MKITFHMLKNINSLHGIRSKILLDGSRMPLIGLGTYQTKSQEDVSATIDCALSIGYRLIDTAPLYNNETAIGNALNSCLCSGKIKRKDLYITTKLPSFTYHSESAMKAAVEKSLDSLKLTYVDMYLVHMPWGMDTLPTGERVHRLGKDHETIWRLMEQFQTEGKTRAIGLSNFSIRQINWIWDMAKIKPQNLQLESHPYLNQANLRTYCQKKGIVITAYAPLGSIGRGKRYIRPDPQPTLLEDPAVLSIANEIKKTPAQVLLKFLMDLEVIPLPKSSNPARLEENMGAFNVTLSPQHIRSLLSLDRGLRYIFFDWAKEHPEYHLGEEF